jgi:hypothetical protein
MGSNASAWIARLQRGDRAVRTGIFNLGRALGGIGVALVDGAEQRPVARLYETGPIAADSHLVPLGSLDAGSRTVRLELGKGHWRLDRVALAPIIERVQPVTLEPREVTKAGVLQHDARAALLAADRTLVTLPGDDYRIRFELPASSHGVQLFLEARGYYLEWMRSEWLAEEDAERARLMLFEPARGLRLLAPEFKLWEPRMEQLFWNSRYGSN